MSLAVWSLVSIVCILEAFGSCLKHEGLNEYRLVISPSTALLPFDHYLNINCIPS